MFQAFVLHQCLVSNLIIPSLLDHGWEMVEDENAIKWNTVKPALEEVLTLMFCTCPRKCLAETLSLHWKWLVLYQKKKKKNACTKIDCENYINKEINNDQNEEEELEDEDVHSEYESEC